MGPAIQFTTLVASTLEDFDIEAYENVLKTRLSGVLSRNSSITVTATEVLVGEEKGVRRRLVSEAALAKLNQAELLSVAGIVLRQPAEGQQGQQDAKEDAVEDDDPANERMLPPSPPSPQQSPPQERLPALATGEMMMAAEMMREMMPPHSEASVQLPTAVPPRRRLSEVDPLPFPPAEPPAPPADPPSGMPSGILQVSSTISTGTIAAAGTTILILDEILQSTALASAAFGVDITGLTPPAGISSAIIIAPSPPPPSPPPQPPPPSAPPPSPPPPSPPSPPGFRSVSDIIIIAIAVIGTVLLCLSSVVGILRLKFSQALIEATLNTKFGKTASHFMPKSLLPRALKAKLKAGLTRSPKKPRAARKSRFNRSDGDEPPHDSERTDPGSEYAHEGDEPSCSGRGRYGPTTVMGEEKESEGPGDARSRVAAAGCGAAAAGQAAASQAAAMRAEPPARNVSPATCSNSAYRPYADDNGYDAGAGAGTYGYSHGATHTKAGPEPRGGSGGRISSTCGGPRQPPPARSYGGSRPPPPMGSTATGSDDYRYGGGGGYEGGGGYGDGRGGGYDDEYGRSSSGYGGSSGGPSGGYGGGSRDYRGQPGGRNRGYGGPPYRSPAQRYGSPGGGVPYGADGYGSNFTPQPPPHSGYPRCAEFDPHGGRALSPSRRGIGYDGQSGYDGPYTEAPVAYPKGGGACRPAPVDVRSPDRMGRGGNWSGGSPPLGQPIRYGSAPQQRRPKPRDGGQQQHSRSRPGRSFGAEPWANNTPPRSPQRHPASSPPKSPEQVEYERAMAKYYEDMKEYEEKLLPTYLASEGRGAARNGPRTGEASRGGGGGGRERPPARDRPPRPQPSRGGRLSSPDPNLRRPGSGDGQGARPGSQNPLLADGVGGGGFSAGAQAVALEAATGLRHGMNQRRGTGGPAIGGPHANLDA